MPKIKFEHKIVTAYLIVGGLWILFSDRILEKLISDINVLSHLQTFKGWFYVVITAILFYLFLQKHLRRIRLAEHDAKESDRLKTIFLQNISHEIRTPMNGILGFAELLNADNLTAEQKREYINIINNSSKRLLSVINDILELSQIESGKFESQEIIFDLNELMNELFDSTKTTVNRLVDFSFRNTLALPDSIIYSDKEKLSRILYHLIDNAAKFTDKGKITFGYNLKNNVLEFYVSDTGIGINQENHKLIFDSFRKTDAGNDRIYDGVGLGLTICKGMLKTMNGNIWLESVPGKGSTFFFNIPYKKCETQVSDNPVSKPDIKQKKVLVVEDDESSFEFIKTVLCKENFNLLHAWNGDDGLQLYEKHKDIDLIILDIKLPGMNGYDVLKAIRKLDSNVPVIAQTAFVMDEERKKAIESGFNEYLSKPYKKDQLLNTIYQLQSKN